MEDPKAVVQNLDEAPLLLSLLGVGFGEGLEEEAEGEYVGYEGAGDAAEVSDDFVHVDFLDDAVAGHGRDSDMHDW